MSQTGGKRVSRKRLYRMNKQNGGGILSTLFGGDEQNKEVSEEDSHKKKTISQQSSEGEPSIFGSSTTLKTADSMDVTSPSTESVDVTPPSTESVNVTPPSNDSMDVTSPLSVEPEEESTSFLGTIVDSAKGVAGEVGNAFSAEDSVNNDTVMEQSPDDKDNNMNDSGGLQDIINRQSQKIDELNEEIKRLLKERITTLESSNEQSFGTGGAKRRRKTHKVNRSSK